MKYRANPIEVDAFVIVTVEPLSDDSNDDKAGFNVSLDNGQEKIAHPAMCARMTPTQGDYWVVQPDGYEYLNPKAVFERKYSACE